MTQTNDRNDQPESEGQWDMENPVVHEKPRRALVSVSFNNSEMLLVSAAAAHEQSKLSTYIKEAALDRAQHSLATVTVMNASVSGTGNQQSAESSSVESIKVSA